MRVLVFGGRTYGVVPPFPRDSRDRAAIREWKTKKDRAIAQIQALFDDLDELHAEHGDAMRLCHGYADGADTCAHWWAVWRRVPMFPYPAEWRRDGVYNPGAGPERNQLMLDQFKPQIGVETSGGRGTADMRSRLEKAGVPIRKVEQ